MYKVVIGLEIHCEMKTATKNFSSAPNEYTNIPNINVSAIDLGLPGILPVVNKEAVRKAIKVALALNCNVPDYLTFDRKNYYYPDLPKGYQITQLHNPIGKDGYLMIDVDGVPKKVLIHDTHLEEDTASLDHLGNYSLIDYNRAGIPLLETVTEPCINSVEEAITFLESYRSLLKYCDISEARSDRGQIRCDVNVSLMRETDKELGTRVEMKNINSFSIVKEALECEIARQTKILDEGCKVLQETRRYDEKSNMTYLMRSKEDAIDYKYYTEPNLPPIKITEELKKEIKNDIPLLPYERYNLYTKEYKLNEKDANNLVRDKSLSDYFDGCLKIYENPVEISNWLNGCIMSYLNKNFLSIEDISLKKEELINLLKEIEKGNISNKQGREVLTEALIQSKNPLDLINEMGVSQISDETKLLEIINEVLNNNISLVNDYKEGKRVFDYIIGQIMKVTRGKASPKLTSELLLKELNKR